MRRRGLGSYVCWVMVGLARVPRSVTEALRLFAGAGGLSRAPGPPPRPARPCPGGARVAPLRPPCCRWSRHHRPASRAAGHEARVRGEGSAQVADAFPDSPTCGAVARTRRNAGSASCRSSRRDTIRAISCDWLNPRSTSRDRCNGIGTISAALRPGSHAIARMPARQGACRGPAHWPARLRTSVTAPAG